MKKKGDIAACKTEKGFKQYEIFRKQTRSFLKYPTQYIGRRSPKANLLSS